MRLSTDYYVTENLDTIINIHLAFSDIFLKRSLTQTADRTTGLVGITLFNVENIWVHCRPHSRDIYFTTVYVVNYF